VDTEISRVVVLAPNWLGDAVMALPAIRDLRRHFSGARLAVLARPSVAMLFGAVPGVDAVLTLAAGGALPPLEADIGILLPNSFRSAWLLRRAGVRERWGYRSDFRGPLLTKAIRRPSRKVHFGEYYQNLVRQLGVVTGPPTPQLIAPRARVEAARTLLQNQGWTPGQALVAIAPGAAFGHAKRWPPARFAALAASLHDEVGARCVVLGRSEDRDASRQMEAALPPGASPGPIDLVGRTDLLALMGVLSHCRALVANDSGTLHLAAALGIPVTGIYGPTDERYSRPLPAREDGNALVDTLAEPVFCRPCFLRDCPIDHRCMKRIPVERVLDSVRRFLQEENPA
jgi:heptosyltransferase-2